MAKLKLKPGNIVYRGNKKYEVRKVVSLKSVLVKDSETGKLEEVPIGHLRAKPEEEPPLGDAAIVPEVVSEEHWEIAKRRYEIIKPLLTPERTKKQVVERASEFGINPTTIYDWIKRYETLETLTELVPKFTERGGKGDGRLDPAAETLIMKTIEDALESGTRKSFKKVREAIEKKCRNAGIEVPHVSTIRRRFKGFSRKKVMAMTEGKEKSRHETRPLRGKHEVKVPLREIQVDESPLDVILVDEKYREDIGRAYGTFAMDVMSRVVYGFYTGLEHPSFFTFGQCMAMGILPKDAYLRKLEVEGSWDVWGLPKGVVLHTDNAKWFRGKDMKLFGTQYNLNPTFRAKKTPECGGHIERLIRTINEALHELPGTTFSNPEQRGDYDSQKMAVMTPKELEQWLADFIVNVYHQKPHRSLDGMSPMQRWEMGVMGNESMPGIGLPDIIQGEDADRLRLTLLPSLQRTIQRATVTVDNIPYFHEVLITASDKGAFKKGRFYLFRRDPRDISFLYYFDPDEKEYFKVPYRNVGWPAMSLWELHRILRYLKEQNIKPNNPEKIFEAYERLNKRVEVSTEKTKAARRAMEMKRIHADQKKSEPKPTGKSKEREDSTDRLKSIFASAKPLRNLKVVGRWKKEEDV